MLSIMLFSLMITGFVFRLADDKWKNDTQDRVLAERGHWIGVLSKLRDKFEHVLINKDIETDSMIASKDTMIDKKLRHDLQSLTKSLNDHEEDTAWLLFAHRQSQQELRDRMGTIIESKK